MSNTLPLDQMIKQAVVLPMNEQLQLIEYLIHNMQQPRPKTAHRKWRDIRGIARYPMLGQDAQEWVSENRNSENGNRESQWNKKTYQFQTPS